MIRTTGAAARHTSFGAAVMCAAMLVGCSPALDWREINPEDSGASALFPCRPENRVRQVNLSGVAMEMHLASCTAAGSNYALSHVDVVDPLKVAPVLQELQRLAANNVGGAPSASGPYNVPGMAPSEWAMRLVVKGSRGDGASIEADAVFFARGSVVYQATAVGSRLDEEATDTFFASLKVR